ncbi:hypothetical protein ACSAK4_001708 [Salmonella enterica subsp. enterica serovar Newport]
MTTITKEWLQQTIAEFENTRDDIPFGLSDDDAKILIVLKRALVSLDAEPVRYLNKFSGTCVTLEQQSNAADDVAVYMPLYAAPPVPVQVDIEILASALKNAPLAPSDNQGRPRAPVVPPAIEPDYKVIKSILPTTNPDEYACCIAADMWNACSSAILQGAEPVSQTYELPELIEGMEVSIDVSTCDADFGNRYFGTVTEVSELDTAKNGYILLVQDAKPNFDVNGNSPAIPDGYALVPVEPTDEMIAAAMECDDVVFDSKDPTAFCVQFREIYCAMITAASALNKGEY